MQRACNSCGTHIIEPPCRSWSVGGRYLSATRDARRRVSPSCCRVQGASRKKRGSTSVIPQARCTQGVAGSGPDTELETPLKPGRRAGRQLDQLQIPSSSSSRPRKAVLGAALASSATSPGSSVIHSSSGHFRPSSGLLVPAWMKRQKQTQMTPATWRAIALQEAADQLYTFVKVSCAGSCLKLHCWHGGGALLSSHRHPSSPTRSTDSWVAGSPALLGTKLENPAQTDGQSWRPAPGLLIPGSSSSHPRKAVLGAALASSATSSGSSVIHSSSGHFRPSSGLLVPA
jgi:hypothetical protein